MKKLWLLLLLAFAFPAFADTEGEPGQPFKSTQPYPVRYPTADKLNPWASLAIGPFALYREYLPANYSNLAIGYGALSGKLSTAGLQDIAIGYNACGKVTDGSQDTCLGPNAGANLTTGVGNMLIGANAGSNISTGSYNVILDSATSAGTYNGTLAVLIGSFTSSAGGSGQTSVGYQAGKVNTGSQNTFVGSNVGITNAGSTGTTKILLIGGNNNSGQMLDTATSSTATTIGIGNGHPGTGDTVVGWGALNTNAQDNANQTAYGFNALTLSNVASAQNSAFGYGAGAALTTGTNNTCLGYNACSATLSTGSNNIVIGASTDTTTSSDNNHINIGGLLHYNNTSTAVPVISACGTGSPTVDANANAKSGMVTAGTVATTCTITFASAYTTWNHCRVTAQGEGTVNASYSYTKSAIVVTAGTLGGAKIDYDCDGF